MRPSALLLAGETLAVAAIGLIAAFGAPNPSGGGVRTANAWRLVFDRPPPTVAELETAFTGLNYDFHAVREGRAMVPRVRVNTVPEDLGQVTEVRRRKALFFASVLPLVLAVNEQIAAERSVIETLAAKLRRQDALNEREAAELNRLARIYKLLDDEDPDVSDIRDAALIDELLLRAAPIPVSLALAQAAEESAWGLSRFAVEGNALYGQWVWNDGAGIVPAARGAGETHSVRAFADLYESTLSYANNLNTHAAYSGFRRMRANMLASSGALDGHALAATLTRYSGRGQAYVESLRAIIRGNDLGRLDRAVFGDDAPVRTAARPAPDTRQITRG
ncbi:MAG: glucosaminidase domain-containing protein [Rhodospirillaceae bacterium]|nr:glucosaminidase domain-containing protein [Rhodospirillaceae bacterium]